MFRDTYKSYNESISPSDKLIADTIDKVGTKKVINFKKPFAIVAVIMALVIVIFSLPVVAAQIDSLYNIMYYISPRFAQFYTPVNESSTSNDVKMEVLACYVHEDTIEIYLTVQDLTGERFSGGVDLNDSYSINTPYDSSANCRQISYDDETKTAGFLITLSQWNDKDIIGDKITFTVKEILTDDRYYNYYVPIELSKVATDKESQEVYINGGSLAKDHDYTTALVPSESYEEFDVHGVDLTGVGYVDGKLHIQYGVKNFLEKDNHGNFYLIDKNTFDTIKTEDSFYFNDSENDISYCESVFDVSEKDLEKYRLFCEFFTTGEYIEGDWKVTFPIENKGEYIPTEQDEIYPPVDINLSDIDILDMGIAVPDLLYFDDSKVIILGTCGIVVYDLNEREITHRLSNEFLKSYGIEYPHGGATPIGNKVYIFDAADDFNGVPREERDGFFIYNVRTRSLIKQKYSDANFESFFECKKFDRKDMEKYKDRSKITGSSYIDKGDYFVFLQGDLDWSMKSLQIVICDYETGDKEIIDVFK